MEGVSIAYVAAVDLIAKTLDQTPLPSGINTAEAGDWVLTINNGREPVEHNGNALGPWELFAENKVYLVFGIISPIGGMIGGMTEGEFIDQMKALGAEVPS